MIYKRRQKGPKNAKGRFLFFNTQILLLAASEAAVTASDVRSGCPRHSGIYITMVAFLNFCPKSMFVTEEILYSIMAVSNPSPYVTGVPSS